MLFCMHELEYVCVCREGEECDGGGGGFVGRDSGLAYRACGHKFTSDVTHES